MKTIAVKKMSWLVAAAVVFLAAMASAQTPPQAVKLRWVQSQSAPVSSNNVYRASVSGGPYSEIFQSEGPLVKYTDATVVTGETYCWVVTAVSNGVESIYSNEVCETVTTQSPSDLEAR